MCVCVRERETESRDGVVRIKKQSSRQEQDTLGTVKGTAHNPVFRDTCSLSGQVSLIDGKYFCSSVFTFLAVDNTAAEVSALGVSLVSL